jgi:hypothetical protein
MVRTSSGATVSSIIFFSGFAGVAVAGSGDCCAQLSSKPPAVINAVVDVIICRRVIFEGFFMASD